ncbi:MAG: hypothetical protein J6C65_06800 [Prevotella sp.]|nr:hypothetical protein [Prevotella sp.]MBO5205827.1 hypothetical protein [Prevotella sp.]
MKINDSNIKDFLQKYMDGITSVEEESMLAEYFRKAGRKKAPDSIPEDDWQAYREMFAMFGGASHNYNMWMRYCAAAAVALLVVIGAWRWSGTEQQNPHYTGDYVTMTTARDTAKTDVSADTTKVNTVPYERKTVKKKVIRTKRLRETPPVPRHYLAEASDNADSMKIDIEEAVRQTDLLIQAVYMQQKIDLNTIMQKNAIAVAEFEEWTDDADSYYIEETY